MLLARGPCCMDPPVASPGLASQLSMRPVSRPRPLAWQPQACRAGWLALCRREGHQPTDRGCSQAPRRPAPWQQDQLLQVGGICWALLCPLLCAEPQCVSAVLVGLPGQDNDGSLPACRLVKAPCRSYTCMPQRMPPAREAAAST